MWMQNWQEQCGVCGHSRWWPSRVYDLKVCWWCSGGNPLTALTVLARRSGTAAVRRAQAWAEASGLRAAPYLTPSMEYVDADEGAR